MKNNVPLKIGISIYCWIVVFSLHEMMKEKGSKNKDQVKTNFFNKKC